jgi:hypothetical protein
VLTGHVEPSSPADRPVTEAVEGGALPASWVGASHFPSEFVTADDGALRVASNGEPLFVGRRQEHLQARVRARLDVEGTGGLSVRIDPRHAVELECSAGRVCAVWAVGDIRHVLGDAALPAGAELEIRLLPDESGNPFLGRGPDIVVAGVAVDGVFTELGRVDGRYLSTEVAGGMTGRMVGVVCRSGAVLVRSLEYVGADDSMASS